MLRGEPSFSPSKPFFQPFPVFSTIHPFYLTLPSFFNPSPYFSTLPPPFPFNPPSLLCQPCGRSPRCFFLFSVLASKILYPSGFSHPPVGFWPWLPASSASPVPLDYHGGGCPATPRCYSPPQPPRYFLDVLPLIVHFMGGGGGGGRDFYRFFALIEPSLFRSSWGGGGGATFYHHEGASVCW